MELVGYDTDMYEAPDTPEEEEMRPEDEHFLEDDGLFESDLEWGDEDEDDWPDDDYYDDGWFEEGEDEGECDHYEGEGVGL